MEKLNKLIFFFLIFATKYVNAENLCEDLDVEFSSIVTPEEDPDLNSKVELLCSIINSTESQITSLLKIPVVNKPKIRILDQSRFQEETEAPFWSQGVFIDGTIYLLSTKFKNFDNSFRSMLKHETFHSFIYSISAFEIPAWLEEGLAELIASESENNSTKIRKIHPKLKNLHTDFHKLPPDLVEDAYDFSLLAAKQLVALRGFDAVGRYLIKLSNGYSNEDAFTEIFKFSESELEKSISTSSLDKSKEPNNASENSLLSNGLRSPTPSPIPK